MLGRARGGRRWVWAGGGGPVEEAVECVAEVLDLALREGFTDREVRSARPGPAWPDTARPEPTRPGPNRHGPARPTLARHGPARTDMVRPGPARVSRGQASAQYTTPPSPPTPTLIRLRRAPGPDPA